VSLLLLLVSLPGLYWPQELASAPALRQAGIERLYVPPGAAAAWREAGFSVTPLGPAELAARAALAAPGIAGGRPDRASATRSPWLTANGWQFLREKGRPYAYDLPAGKAALAAAEAFAYGADAVLKIDPADLEAVGRMLAFLTTLPAADLPDVADLGLVDDGTPLTGEVMNLLVRRNLLFRVVDAPAPQWRVNIRLGTSEYPKKEAADPSAFALKVRRQLTDDERSLRLFGSEVVIGRLTGDATRVRLHLLNYGGRETYGLRIRLRGTWAEGEAFVAGKGRVPLPDRVIADGATEFSLPAMGPYAVIDLSAAK
jgi:hypothetical protein